jgi:hypothetical protein
VLIVLAGSLFVVRVDFVWCERDFFFVLIDCRATHSQRQSFVTHIVC